MEVSQLLLSVIAYHQHDHDDDEWQRQLTFLVKQQQFLQAGCHHSNGTQVTKVKQMRNDERTNVSTINNCNAQSLKLI